MASILEGYSYDIFISYRQKDNKYDGWVTEFVDNLQRELESAFKEEISVYFDINPHNGLLETHDVSASLEEKLKCLVFIPILSRTYCDPRSYAWDHEFRAFAERVSKDKFGFKIALPGGNIATRVLPVRINDLNTTDTKLCESILGGVLRPVDFIYRSAGVNRPLRSKDDEIIKSPTQILYRDQINKVSLAVMDIIESIKSSEDQVNIKEKEIKSKPVVKKEEAIKDEPASEESGRSENEEITDVKIPERKGSFFLIIKKPKILVPGVLLVLAIFSATVLFMNHHSEVIWAKKEAISEIQQYINEMNFTAAFNTVQKAEKYISKDPKFKKLASIAGCKLTILSDPTGADIYIRQYTDTTAKWIKLGKTPVDSIKMPILSFYCLKMEKPGYENILAVLSTQADTIYRKLWRKDSLPRGMVYVEGLTDELAGDFLKVKNGFFMDRCEVTNRQYKEFIDKGGYRDPGYWKNKFIKDGKILSREIAMAEFTDKSGRPGPATWEGGDYPDGQDEYPVGGISWYEAAAYAVFSGKDLPTSDHWESGAGFYFAKAYDNFGSKLFPASNFKGNGPEPVGKNKAINCFGAFDMSGNVREWCWNESKNGHIIRGGGWDDPDYMYASWSQVPAFDRSYKNGFRCVKYIDKGKIPETAFQKVEYSGPRDYSKEKPISEDVFRIYKNLFMYDNLALETEIVKSDESNEDWIVEKVTFNAAYNKERVIGFLFLPKNAVPPYQTLILFPGSYAFDERDLEHYKYLMWFSDFIVKSGRAVFYPVYKGTYERRDESIGWQGHQYTDILIKWVKDFSRSIDYLKTRPDIDTNKFGFYGHSWGGEMGGIIPAVEERLAVNVLVVGGFDSWRNRDFPEADEINYVPRIKIPTLMLNGKYDMFFPYETTVKPFFDLLGTPAKDKRLVIYDTDHGVPKSEMIKETLNFLDKYLGPVK
jgi:eukaryotic-like serine/threonine-protein kinase